MSSTPDWGRVVKVMESVRQDIRTDVAGLDGMEATGKNLAAVFGQLYAAVDAVAHVAQVLAEHAEKASSGPATQVQRVEEAIDLIEREGYCDPEVVARLLRDALNKWELMQDD